MRIDLELNAPVLFVIDGAVRFGHVSAINLTHLGMTVQVHVANGTPEGTFYRADLEDIREEPWSYGYTTANWLRDKLDPPEPEPELEAPVAIPIETTKAHGVEIPVRSVEAPEGKEV